MTGGARDEPVRTPALADRDGVLRDLSRHLTAAWASFDHPRPAEPELKSFDFGAMA